MCSARAEPGRRPLRTAALLGAALVLLPAAATAKVAEPRLVRHIATGETGWFSSPGLADVTGDGRPEIVAPFSSTFVYAARGRLLGKGTASKGRVYAPSVVADLDGDGRREIVVGGDEGTVAAYRFTGGHLRLVPGWPASTCSAGQCPETRGLAAGDLDGDGRLDIVLTTIDHGIDVYTVPRSDARHLPWPTARGGLLRAGTP